MKGKKILSGVVLSVVALSAVLPLADLFQSKAAFASPIDEKIAAAQATIANAQASSSEAQAALNTLQTSVDSANTRVAQIQDESNKTHEQIMALKETIAQRDKSLKTQARSAQVNGGVTSYINTILNAKSLTDIVQKMTAMSQVVQAIP